MNIKTKKLEVSQNELDLIASALETQTKILNMQASAGGHGALARLNEVKRLLAEVSSQREKGRAVRPAQTGMWGLLRSMGQTI
jgi:phage-related tail protein